MAQLCKRNVNHVSFWRLEGKSAPREKFKSKKETHFKNFKNRSRGESLTGEKFNRWKFLWVGDSFHCENERMITKFRSYGIGEEALVLASVQCLSRKPFSLLGNWTDSAVLQLSSLRFPLCRSIYKSKSQGLGHWGCCCKPGLPRENGQSRQGNEIDSMRFVLRIYKLKSEYATYTLW